MSIKRLILLAVLAAAIACGVLPVGAGRAQEFDLLGRVAVPLDGTTADISTEGIRYHDIRTIVEGSLHCSHDEKTYYPTEEIRKERGVIQCNAKWKRAGLVETESTLERAVLLWPESSRDWPSYINARVNIDLLAKRLGITPSEVRASLSGDLTLEVWVNPVGGENPLAFIPTKWDFLVAVLWRALLVALVIAAVAAGLRVWSHWRHARK